MDKIKHKINEVIKIIHKYDDIEEIEFDDTKNHIHIKIRRNVTVRKDLHNYPCKFD